MDFYPLNYLPLTGGTLKGSLTLPATGSLLWTGQGGISSPADGTLTLLNNAGTGFTRLQIGGTSSSFPALQANGNALQVALADGSSFTNLQAFGLALQPGTALTAGGSTTMAVTLSSGVIGLYVGSGAPSITAAKGSLYLRSDGSGTTDRAFINTTGSTTWTALTTVA